MPELLDIAIVSVALAGAAWFVGRRLFRRDDSACGTACGKCESNPTNGDAGNTSLVQIGKHNPKP